MTTSFLAAQAAPQETDAGPVSGSPAARRYLNPNLFSRICVKSLYLRRFRA